MTTYPKPQLMPSACPLQQPTPMPVHRYSLFVPTIDIPDRTWPSQTLTKAPRWLSTDLRDGNQALPEPMTPARKHKMFQLLVDMGYKEIEIGFPSASQMDYDFVRSLIEDDLIPDDVTISVLTQAREDLIDRTAQSLIGAQRATIHMYNATAELFRRVVFRMDEQECKELAQRGTRWVIEAAERHLPNVQFGYEYSPEIFTQTPTDFAIEVVNGVIDVWQPDGDRELIVNLPATVEMSTPNTYADMIEYFCRNVNQREDLCISLHPHNDRGTAVAATELALMAGADRVEGCLFGHGERTGNVDLVTLGLNLYTQGVDPKIDFSNLIEVRSIVEYCTGLKVPDRQPYSGDLVYTAFSGSHQDAIKKGLEDLQRQADQRGISIHDIEWEAPYLPIDPADVGRAYEAIIRVNSQSGKGGMAYIMRHDHNLDLPRRLQMEFSHVVQQHTEESGEVSSEEIWQYFSEEYLDRNEPFSVSNYSGKSNDQGEFTIKVSVDYRGKSHDLTGVGNGPVSAFTDALAQLGVTVHILDYAEHAMTSGGDASAASYMECEVEREEQSKVLWGVGIDSATTLASLKAIISALNRF